MKTNEFLLITEGDISLIPDFLLLNDLITVAKSKVVIIGHIIEFGKTTFMTVFRVFIYIWKVNVKFRCNSGKIVTEGF